MTPAELTKARDELAEAYATGNHRASFADTSDEKAFKAGFDARGELAKAEIEQLNKDCGIMANERLEQEWPILKDRDRWRELCEKFEAMVQHAIYLGYIGEGSTRGWAKTLIKEFEGMAK